MGAISGISRKPYLNPHDFNSWLQNPHRRPLLMGVLNLTPDSFSDGGKYLDPGKALDHTQHMVSSGAEVIDIGGESTRPGAQRIDSAEQIRRIVPIISALRPRVPAVLSIDTTRADVAHAALNAGADLINDISAARDDPDMLPLAVRRAVPIILMHMQGTPATMQVNPTYDDVVTTIREFLRTRAALAEAAGVEPWRILIDPGIGFGKTDSHNLEILRHLSAFKELGRPIAVGTSRKGFVGKITGETLDSGRPFGTAASVAWSITNGARLLRVHDVGPMSQVVRMIGAIEG
jgi:dihydropteroate synthase